MEEISDFEKAIRDSLTDKDGNTYTTLTERVVSGFVNMESTSEELISCLENENDCLKFESRQTIDVGWELKRIITRRDRAKKTYKMTIQLKGDFSTRTVWLFGEALNPAASLKLVNHSPDGFNWGYPGSGPAQLALAICLEIMGPDKALKVYQSFKFKYIAGLPQADFEKDIFIEI